MRLLLAEDEIELARALSVILKHNNYSVDVVYNGNDALDYLSDEIYDGVVLDIMMPGIDGLTVLKKIRAKGNSVPVLLLTAKSDIDDRVEGLDSGADDYLTKPFATKELLARIRAMTRRKGETTDSVLTVGNLRLDRSTYELSAPDGSVRLTNKEFQIIEMLMINPTQIIPSERFIEKIWGYESDTELNIVWVYISNIRKKLASMGANVTIRAARNIGYTLEQIND